ncbi:vWA domain-containing protein [Algicola sagamiensis]|uniref:vWA domain-containing protein n=1 Tax=Algicola sagamiensis TaxID=163869 RepID=UPI00037F1EDE|nr:VWA domain-containing protein [Algicola sagamiensis]
MLIDFFMTLRKHRVPCTLREYLDLLNALEKGIVFADIEGFYYLSRAVLVKDETHYDRFDRGFGEYFEGIQSIDWLEGEIPEEWLRKEFEKFLTEEEKAKLQSLSSLEELMEKFRERMKEQQKRHAGGNKWIGTGGTSPFGAYGFHPGGIRIGQKGNRNRQAAKVWDKRAFRNLDSDAELGSRNMKLALKKLRKFARVGASEELDLHETIHGTAKKGMLDVNMRPERHNAVNVLMFFDVGGSMDDHVQICQDLFSAAHGEFKHLEFFYFHNCIYEGVWKDSTRRYSEVIDTFDIIHRFGRDYKVIFVGDATMGPYEIAYPGGSVEHWNEESGEVWMQRLVHHFDKAAWLNPQSEEIWGYYPSIQQMRGLMDERMFPLTLDGISTAIKSLT